MQSEEKNNLGPFLQTKFGDFFLHPVNRNEFVNEKSSDQYKRAWDERLFSEDAFSVIIGTDSGNLLQYIRENPLKDGSRYVFVDLDSVIARLPEILALEELDEKIRVVSYAELRKTLEDFRLSDYFVADKVRLYFSFAAQAGYLPEYRELQWQVQQDFKQMQFEVSAKLGSESFFRCQMQNLAENRIQAGVLEGGFRGRTAVLLGAGPSLDEYLPWVAENRSRIALFAVSRVSGRLQEYGIVPDLIFSVDPQEISLTVSQEILAFAETSILVNAYHVAPSLMGQWPGRSLYVGPRYPWEKPQDEKWIPSRGPTVTHCALEAAVYLGFSQVFLVGVDLCLSREGFTHATGSVERETGARVAADYCRVETYCGEIAETPPGYFFGIKALAIQAHEAAAKGTRFFNVNRSAAKVPGVEYAAIDEIHLHEPDVPIREILLSLLPTDSSDARIAHYEEVLAELDRIEIQLKAMEKLATRALECNAKLFGRNGRRPDFSFKKKMDKIEEKLNRDFSGLAQWVKTYSARDFIKMPRGMGGRDWSKGEIEDAGDFYYKTYRSSIGTLKKLLRSSRQRVKDRLAEEGGNVDWERVLVRWDADGEPGRSRVWAFRNPEKMASLRPETCAALANREKKFADSLSARKESFREDARKGWDLKGVRAKAMSLFRGQARDLLANLVGSLAQSSDDMAKIYQALTRGYLAEMDKDYSQALACYEGLVGEDTPPDVLEDALKRILVISLDQRNAENALLVLDCLSAISPTYQPKYGELLRMTGNLEQAVAVYSDYLPKVPGDLDAMVNLGQIYRQAGQQEAARLAAENVLSRDSGHQGALTLLDSLEKF